ncbi:hypothetical protein B6U81_05920 [Thermoplasmatales archaeon ex4484_30]|nr:MAG: hypothetical protein B6U81_05920 [Thermoplasmatales archaeon ex4484_30]
MDVVIEGKAFINGEIKKCCIGIEEGKIVSIKKILHGKKHYDCGDALLFPAAIDVHVHFRDPGMTEKEDFFTGTRAAAYGGISCIFDMPNNSPPTIRKEYLEKKVRVARNKACVDFAFYGGIGKGSNVEALAKICKAFKIYLCKSNEIFVPLEKLRDILKRVKKTGKILAIHAEDEKCLIKDKASDLAEYEKRRPIKCEISALHQIIKSNEEIGVPIHICHISSLQGERKKLWNAMKNGMISIIESDHAPHLLQEKERFQDAPPGMPGVDAMLPILLFMVKKGKISLSLVHSLMCSNPARIFGIKKGKIEVGRDADILAINFKEKEVVSHSKCGWSCYEGWKGVYPSHFWLRGERIIEEGEFTGFKSMGKMIP